MIINFTLENWMSFRDPATFSMVASKERQHGSRVPKVDKYQTRVLPIAAVYGGNASGKSNFFKALDFAKRFVVNGTQPDGLIPVEPFRLVAEQDARPSRFLLELLIDEKIYEFSFAVTGREVLEEKLIEISSASEKVLYHRRQGAPNFHDSLSKNEFLKFAFHGTRDNQLFLTNAVSQKVDDFRPVYDWFKHRLVLVPANFLLGPFDQFFEEGQPVHDLMNDALPQLDTGIARLGNEEMPLEKVTLPEEYKSGVRHKLLDEGISEDKLARFPNAPGNQPITIARKGNDLTVKKLITFHSGADGSEAKFEFQDESDGSQRVIGLLPAFIHLSERESKAVYVIDEIDRSLHTHLTRKLIETYLATCAPQTRSQLLLTTHDALLIDQQLLRRDEMWVTERNADGSTSLFSFSEYTDIRYDKDICKSYLQGRLGGIPRILLAGTLTNPDTATEDVG